MNITFQTSDKTFLCLITNVALLLIISSYMVGLCTVKMWVLLYYPTFTSSSEIIRWYFLNIGLKSGCTISSRGLGKTNRIISFLRICNILDGKDLNFFGLCRYWSWLSNNASSASDFMFKLEATCLDTL